MDERHHEIEVAGARKTNPGCSSTQRKVEIPLKSNTAAILVTRQPDSAIEKATSTLLLSQQPSGFWVFDLETDVTIPSEYVFLHRILNKPLPSDIAERLRNYILDKQLTDGGWGETCYSYFNPEMAGMGESTPSQTSWALMALIAAGEIRCRETVNGICYLLETQDDNGIWEEEHFTGTGFPAESRHQLRKNISVTKDQVFRNIMEYSHWKANPRLVRAYVEKSADTLMWLEKMGVVFTDVRTSALGGAMTWHIFKGRGASVIKALKKILERQGGEIRQSVSVKALLRDGNGKISGTIAGSECGPDLEIKSKAVVIATGGFANNKKMLAEYTDCGENAVAIGNNGKMGEGLKMAWAAGAAKAGTGVVQLRGPVMEGEKVHSGLNAVTKQPYLWINLDGERFCDESIVTNWPHAGNALAAQPGQTLFLVIDTDTKRYLAEKGTDMAVGDFTPAGTKLATIDSELDRGMKKGLVFAAESPAELAKKCGVDPRNLEHTVDEYNAMCQFREDTLFGKSSRYMHSVRRAPFYALKLVPSLLGTLGGIRINHKTEVLDTGGRIIPGLYAAGNDAGGMYGDTYDLLLSPGSTFGFAVNSGRIAGENALKYLSKINLSVSSLLAAPNPRK